MWTQVLTIAWAQLRITRNHLPRTRAGPIVATILALLWYGLYVGGAIALASVLPSRSLAELRLFLPAGLLAVFAFWQIIPLFTLSGGWSLQLNKLQIYPVPDRSLFSLEVFLRLTTAPEMIILLCGALIGLLKNPALAVFSPFCLLLFLPFNLLLSLGIRELIMHSFARSRFRELFAILLVSISIVPQILVRTEWGQRSTPYLLRFARYRPMPWSNVARLSLSRGSLFDVGCLLAWTALACWFAWRQFEKTLRQDDAFQSAARSASVSEAGGRRVGVRFFELLTRVFGDPLGALIEKELRSLLRTPRFRVILGMATFFSILLFMPLSLGNSHSAHGGFIHNNFLPVVTLYGLLLLSDSLLLNMFGFDRAATQVYFVTPVNLGSVVTAKNIVAIFFISIQCAVVLALSLGIRIAGAKTSDLTMTIGATAVVSLFYLAIGNLMSVYLARPIDPMQTFKKQAGGKAQLWFFGCSLGMFVLVGFAYLARWAFQTDWALVGVLLLEFAVGLIAYRIATQSALEYASTHREDIIDKLSKNLSPIGSS
ncbi:MAG: hypothetical protein JO108_07055 [Acidobacteriaceae bacterium]|nr:hypothetical protein [Acidobacteriaceae bacterium]